MAPMPSSKRIEHTGTTLPFDAFWNWVQTHPNCIIRAGTPEAVVYDHEDLHWHFTAEGAESLVVQVFRGKQLVGEIVITPGDVSYVQGMAGEEDEFVFDCISETQTDRVAAYYFVLSHGYEAQDRPGSGRAVH